MPPISQPNYLLSEDETEKEHHKKKSQQVAGKQQQTNKPNESNPKRKRDNFNASQVSAEDIEEEFEEIEEEIEEISPLPEGTWCTNNNWMNLRMLKLISSIPHTRHRLVPGKDGQFNLFLLDPPQQEDEISSDYLSMKLQVKMLRPFYLTLCSIMTLINLFFSAFMDAKQYVYGLVTLSLSMAKKRRRFD